METLLRPALCGFQIVVAACLLSACGKGSAQRADAITVTDKDKGSTIPVKAGEEVTVVLGSTYWTITGPSDSHVLRAEGSPEIAPDHSCVAGQGCGTVTAHFTAIESGTATITASRSSCGEAAGCTPGNDSYSVTVQVQ